MAKKKKMLQPIRTTGRKITHTWWGQAWCNNLESYADFENRIARGRSYLRKGTVLDLSIEEGLVKAQVQGSRRKPYSVEIRIDKLSKKRWEKVLSFAAHQLDSLDALVEGQFPDHFAALFTQKGDGLFPAPSEIHLSCSCPDWANMCKHVTAVLYGVGVRLDEDPLLFFSLRGIAVEKLIKTSIEEKMSLLLENANKKSKRALSDEEAQVLFTL